MPLNTQKHVHVEPWGSSEPNARLLLSNGLVLKGYGIGVKGMVSGEICFNTAMTGYQEVLTDPSYFGQIILFTFPHIGNTGTNDQDIENLDVGCESARGLILSELPTLSSSWRATQSLEPWLCKRKMTGIAGIDTRALTRLIRRHGVLDGVIMYADSSDAFDETLLYGELKRHQAQKSLDYVPNVTSSERHEWKRLEPSSLNPDTTQELGSDAFHVVAIDYGIKRNILRMLHSVGCRVTIVPADTTYEDIRRLAPDGVFLSNGPGDPEATGVYAVPTIQALIKANFPIFGICLGHQLIGLSVGGRTRKMVHGHHGINHPVKDLQNDIVQIVSMNHGYAVDAETLPKGVTQTHVSLFDGSNCGIQLDDHPVFSVQFHPEASPGPSDAHRYFKKFVELMRERSRS